VEEEKAIREAIEAREAEDAEPAEPESETGAPANTSETKPGANPDPVAVPERPEDRTVSGDGDSDTGETAVDDSDQGKPVARDETPPPDVTTAETGATPDTQDQEPAGLPPVASTQQPTATPDGDPSSDNQSLEQIIGEALKNSDQVGDLVSPSVGATPPPDSSPDATTASAESESQQAPALPPPIELNPIASFNESPADQTSGSAAAPAPRQPTVQRPLPLRPDEPVPPQWEYREAPEEIGVSR